MAMLSNEDRAFFELVAGAAFSNPFSAERDALDAKIAGSGANDIENVLVRVMERLDAMDRAGARTLADFSNADRPTMLGAYLFDAFHRNIDALDRHIRDQLAAGDTPVPIPLATDVIASLATRGLPAEEAVRYFAMFHQLRRAYFFIAHALTGASASMRELRRRLWNNVVTHDLRRYALHLWDRMEDFSTLLLGETGTGKGAAANAIGRSGFIPYNPRTGTFTESFTRAYSALNLSQFPESLIESELFGHRKGAFTGAIADYDGAFSRCSVHGAIFLDEIGELSVPVQTKILRVLQEREFSPVGSHERKRFSGRVIAATNRPLDERLRGGSFRRDLYYRLCSDEIRVPTLRQRLAEDPAELDLLVGQIVTRVSGHVSDELAATVASALRRHPGADYAWPGNVRELEQGVRRVLLTGDYTPTAADAEPAGDPFLRAVGEGSLSAADLLAGYCARLFSETGNFGAVARRTGLDRRTARKHVLAGQAG